MAGATFKAVIDFGAGSTFDPALVLDDPSTPLDVGVLGTAAADLLDITQYVQNCQIRRAYNRNADSFLAGTAQLRLIDTAGIFNPADVSGPYYGKILPMRKIRFTATDLSGSTYALGSMYIQSWRYTSPAGFSPAFIELTCSDGFLFFNLSTISTITGGTAGQTTAQRITSILDDSEVDWPGAMRSISTTATTTVQADDGTSRSALAALQTVEQTDLGALYMNENGYLTFMSRADIITASGGTVTTFSDTGAAGTIAYESATFDLTDVGIVNSCSVTRTGGSAQTDTDAASALVYGTRSKIRTSIAQTDADALAQAQTIIASRKEVGADLRIDSLTINASDSSSAARVTAALDLDIFDPISVRQTLPGGAVTSNTVITGVGYDISPGSFRTIFTCSQPFAVGFVLDSTVDGLLDEDSLAY
jgi:hypothetical protein